MSAEAMISARAYVAAGSDKSTTEACADCSHGWHGLPCRATPCACPSSWQPPEDMDQA